MSVVLRPSLEPDLDPLWAIFRQIAEEGTTLAHDAQTTRAGFVESWLGRGGEQWVAESGGSVLGGYTVRANHPGRGSHVGTATYIVAQEARGQGVGLALGEHSLERARRMGFTAMQFNIVVSTNDSAVRLWKRLGFQIVGQLPGVFRHATLGPVDAYVMHRFLSPEGK